MYEAAGEAVARARAGGGPTLVVAETYRYEGHSTATRNLYRTKEEIEAWRTTSTRSSTPRAWSGVRTALATEAEIDGDRPRGGRRDARPPRLGRAPRPIASPTRPRRVYASYEHGAAATRAQPPSCTYAEALREALRLEMRRTRGSSSSARTSACTAARSSVTGGLLDRFGPDRYATRRSASSAIVGAASGGAHRPAAGRRRSCSPTSSRSRWTRSSTRRPRTATCSAARRACRLVVRTQGGSGRGRAAQHRQSLEAWFAHVPASRSCMPATPADAKGLLAAAIRDHDPVMFFEHKLLYRTKGAGPGWRTRRAARQGRRQAPGTRLTIVELVARWCYRASRPRPSWPPTASTRR